MKVTIILFLVLSCAYTNLVEEQARSSRLRPQVKKQVSLQSDFSLYQKYPICGEYTLTCKSVNVGVLPMTALVTTVMHGDLSICPSYFESILAYYSYEGNCEGEQIGEVRMIFQVHEMESYGLIVTLTNVYLTFKEDIIKACNCSGIRPDTEVSAKNVTCEENCAFKKYYENIIGKSGVVKYVFEPKSLVVTYSRGPVKIRFRLSRISSTGCIEHFGYKYILSVVIILVLAVLLSIVCIIYKYKKSNKMIQVNILKHPIDNHL